MKFSSYYLFFDANEIINIKKWWKKLQRFCTLRPLLLFFFTGTKIIVQSKKMIIKFLYVGPDRRRGGFQGREEGTM